MAAGQVSQVSISLSQIALARGGRLIFQNFGLDAAAGDIIWLRGANGSGKSSLLRLVAGLLRPLAGSRQINGRIALADENTALDGHLSVEAALQYWARLDGGSAATLQNAMAAFDLAGLADIPVAYLSSGQRKRAALARMMQQEAEIWLLDEPYNGLDSASASRLDEALLRHARNGGIAIVAAHQPATINISDTIWLGVGESKAA